MIKPVPIKVDLVIPKFQEKIRLKTLVKTPYFDYTIELYRFKMSARAISEASGKRLLNEQLSASCGAATCR